MMKPNKPRLLLEILLLSLPVLIYAWFFWRYLAMRPDVNDPLEYIGPSVWRTFVGGYAWLDRVLVADGIRLLGFFFRPELAGAVYFGLINFAILAVATIWTYLKRGFWTAFLTASLLAVSFPVVRYANYGYPDATVALFGLLALIFALMTKPTLKTVFVCGLFAALACLSKITGAAFVVYFLIFFLAGSRRYFLKNYLAGLLVGAAGSLTLTGLLFGFNSVWYVFTELGNNIATNTAPREVLRSIGNVLFPAVWFPAYASLIFFRKAYHDQTIRPIYFLSLFFIGWFGLLFLASSHIKIYPHYLYAASILASVGTAWYLGKFPPAKERSVALTISGLMIVGMGLGVKFSASFTELINLSAPWILMGGYIFFGVLGLLLLVLLGRHQKAVLAIVLAGYAVGIGGFFVVGSANATIQAQKKEIAKIYGYAQKIAEAPKGPIVIQANLTADEQAKVLWVYSLFFDQKYDRSSASSNLAEVRQAVRFEP